MNLDSILSKSINKGRAKAREREEQAKVPRKAVRTAVKPVKINVPGLGAARIDDIVARAAAKHLSRKKKKKEKAKLRRAKPEDREPAFRISFDFIMSIYDKLGITPMRAVYWYKYPLLKRDWTNDERTKATPLAAMCLLRYQDLPHQEGVLDYEVRHSKFIDEPSYTWVNGSVVQLLSTAYKGLTSGYLLGFMSGFDGNKKWPTFHMMSLVYTRGFEDGHVILEKMLTEGLVTKEGSLDEENDIYKDEKDENALNELYRIRGYKREGFEPYSKEKKFVSEAEMRKQKLHRVFNNGEIRKNDTESR